MSSSRNENTGGMVIKQQDKWFLLNSFLTHLSKRGLLPFEVDIDIRQPGAKVLANAGSEWEPDDDAYVKVISHAMHAMELVMEIKYPHLWKEWTGYQKRVIEKGDIELP